MYAVIRTGGKQYVVSEGDVITVEKLSASKGEGLVIDDVLFIAGEDGQKIGTPNVEGARVEATVVDEGRLRKVLVYKYRRRKRYRRKYGHRQAFSKIRIDRIVTSQGD